MIRIDRAIILTSVFGIGVFSGGFFLSDNREPCFRNMKEATLAPLFQTMADGKDGPYGPALTQLPDYTDSYGRRYYVPSTCEVEDDGFRVTLWQK